MPRTRIKICCIQSEAEAQLRAIAAGADALGLVGTMPSGPGPIDDELIAGIVASRAAADRDLPPDQRDRVPKRSSRTRAAAGPTRCSWSTAWLTRPIRVCARALPGIKLVQVIHASQGRKPSGGADGGGRTRTDCC